jgi:hypothetical protein
MFALSDTGKYVYSRLLFIFCNSKARDVTHMNMSESSRGEKKKKKKNIP